MVLRQQVRDGIAVVQLLLDPERKKESFSGLPRVTILKAEPGEAPRASEAELRWTGADVLTLEVPLRGTETALTTVQVPGQRPISLPPVCLPYSPELKPQLGEGSAALEKLARATGGRERVDLKGIWADLPRRPRDIALAPWLLSLAVVLLLLEAFERRTGLLTRPRRLSRSTAEEKKGRRCWPIRRKVAAAPPAAPAVAEAAPEKPPTPPPPVEEPSGMIDALRKARRRSQSRLD
jgi:hypothetical protein